MQINSLGKAQKWYPKVEMLCLWQNQVPGEIQIGLWSYQKILNRR